MFAKMPLPSVLLIALSGVALTLPLSAQAQAVAPALQFYPSDGWDLAKNNQNCVLSSAFNNGFTMALSGSDSWVEALNINFQQSIFEPKKIYNVALSVPGVSDARYEGVAVDASTLSLNFKESRKLYKAMRSAAVVDMNVESNDFRFYLTGFPKAADGFERCMAGGGLEAAPDPAVREARAKEAEAKLKGLSVEELTSKKETVSKPVALVDAKAQELVSTVKDLNLKPEDTDFAQNEAQAMEAEMAGTPQKAPQAVTEILPEDPKMVMNEIPYKEVVKVKDEIVEERIVSRDAEMVESAPATEQPVEMVASEPPVPVANPVPEPVLRVREPEVSKPVIEEAVPMETSSSAVIATPVLDEPVAEPVVVAEVEVEAAPVQTREQAMKSALIEEIRKNPDLISNGGGLVDFRQSPDARVAVLSKAAVEAETEVSAPVAPVVNVPEIVDPMADATPAPVLKSNAEEMQVTDVMLPDSESTPPVELETNIETTEPPQSLPELETRDVETLDAVKPNGEMQEREKPSAPKYEKPVQVAEEHRSPAMTVRRERMEAEADFTRLEPAGDDAGSRQLASRVADLERQLMALKRENEALNDDLKVTLSAAEEERMSISSENWNLERATMRYNEAERQIKRLGQQLQQERARHKAEIQEMEAMLFDPQVTNEQQMARLADLERQLMATKEELQNQRMIYEERIRALEAMVAQ